MKSSNIDSEPYYPLEESLLPLILHRNIGRYLAEFYFNVMSCLQDGTYELNHPFDLNMYLDTILKVVLHSAGSRKIIFSCFHPDICTMLVIGCVITFNALFS